MKRTSWLMAITTTLLLSPAFGADKTPNTEPGALDGAIPDNDDRVRFYTTPREKREAGVGTKLSDWLTFYGLLEVEASTTKDQFRNTSKTSTLEESTTTVQLGFKAAFDENVEAEIVLEFDDSQSESTSVDEAFVELKKGDAGVLIGREALPFGEYYSHFVTDPLLEFGETTRNTVQFGYEYEDIFEAAVFVYDGNSEKVGDEGKIREWGAALNFMFLNNRIAFGASYLSNLADSDAELLSDFDNMYEQKVGAWSAYAAFRPGNWEMTLEGVQAAEEFRELPANANEPRAWNAEIAYYIGRTWEIAARYERSAELEDKPEERYGIGATWAAHRNVTLSLEYLQGNFKPGFAFDDDGNELKREQIMAAQVAVIF